MDREIKYLIDRELHNRDMSQNSVNPDLKVAFSIGIDMDALGLKVNPDAKKATLTNVPAGGLFVALVDSKSRFVLWMGVAEAELQKHPDAKTVKARLAMRCRSYFKRYPTNRCS